VIQRRPRPIMIVEDDPYIMSTMTEVFLMMDRQMIVAQNGKLGIEKLKKLRPDEFPCCIILDLMMPEMTGQEFIFHIQALGNVELDSIPIVVSSADPKLKNLDSPRIRYKLQKPINLKDLEDIAEMYY
jgi:CheY-like chemotaxis protein